MRIALARSFTQERQIEVALNVAGEQQPGLGKVLIVDDEADVRSLIAASLARAGWETIEAAHSAQALTALKTERISAVTLDVNLKAESGYQLCRDIRALSPVPILFVSARIDEFDHVLGLELGASAFITKPFSPRILVAEVAAAVRGAVSKPEEDSASTVQVGPVRLDFRSRRVTVAGSDVALSKLEFQLLEVFMRDPRRAFERVSLLHQIWGPWFGDDHVVEVTVGRLRRKLAAAGCVDFIETLRGVGYRLATPD